LNVDVLHMIFSSLVANVLDVFLALLVSTIVLKLIGFRSNPNENLGKTVEHINFIIK